MRPHIDGADRAAQRLEPHHHEPADSSRGTAKARGAEDRAGPGRRIASASRRRVARSGERRQRAMSQTRGTVKKLINDPANVIDEMLDAFVAVHSDIVSLPAPRVVARAQPAEDKVGMTVGGGSGHEPAMLGYVGLGMADTAAAGNIFAAPSPDIILESIRQAHHGQGVVLVYGNYSGDVLNCRLAVQRAAAEGIDVRSVFVSDDVASAPREEIDKRRGIAGDIPVFKATGAA